jgi:hypothetical protein
MKNKIIYKYRGRSLVSKDIEFKRELIKNNPKSSRRDLSKKLCVAWNWVQENGTLKDMVCRGLMLGLHREGQISLPEIRRETFNPFLNRKSPDKMTSANSEVLECSLKELGPLTIKQVRQSKEEDIFNSYIETYHYLSYTQPVGEHMKYMVYAGDRPIACLAWCSPVRHLSSRDKYIGWSPEIRTKNLHFIAYNTRYLIFPWVKVPHLASHLLGRMSKIVPTDWKAHYNHTIFFLETFVEPERYKGTCYRASNWISIGETTGRGIKNKSKKAILPVKEVFVYPLKKDFRKSLCLK